MTNMQTFVTWFLEQLPAFLLSDPISYFIGFSFLFVAIRLIKEIIRL